MNEYTECGVWKLEIDYKWFQHHLTITPPTGGPRTTYSSIRRSKVERVLRETITNINGWKL